MTKNDRIKAFSQLGEWLLQPDQDTLWRIESIQNRNPWYTKENILKQFQAIGQNLTVEKLEAWTSPYEVTKTSKVVGLVLAGNIPLVGFHDVLSTLILGFTAQIKLSSDDAGLSTIVLNKLVDIQPQFHYQIQVVEKLAGFDLVIATGSNNTARYFEYYFGSKPNIIRKNRNSIAVLTGNETTEQLMQLGNDIFDYFGLGCRSVSKLFIPKDYPIATFFEAIEQHSPIKDHYKYNNNYDYNKSIYLVNGDKHYDNGFLLLKKDENIASPLAVVFYQEYESLQEVEDYINARKENIQCVTSSAHLNIESPLFSLGGSQCPALDDYADGINTLKFLTANQ
ncbi:acyl-CoA reductase [Sphingobacterium litopenaei]|uniref:Acyl-CoA reductase n=1 Tax=Sphingobacterium litopenaei TaxID=2763500 RepID=A0ABR7YFE6_9SPHI|nr:acyl-CoA reductase [Sphingobacterium litopenaei]MBD1430038.1 acyl-CoA reductase [Sphingobacterium litopenaei]